MEEAGVMAAAEDDGGGGDGEGGGGGGVGAETEAAARAAAAGTARAAAARAMGTVVVAERAVVWRVATAVVEVEATVGEEVIADEVAPTAAGTI